MKHAARIFFLNGYRGFPRGLYGKYFSSAVLLFSICLLVIPLRGQELEDILKIAEDYYEKEQYHSAAEYYQVAVGYEEDNAQTTFRLARSYQAIFDYFLAAQYFQMTMDLDPAGYPVAPFFLAQMQKSMGNFKKARDEFEKFIRTNSISSFIPRDERDELLRQAEIETEGCSWAIDQLGKSWKEMGFTILPEPVNSSNNDYAAVSIGEEQIVTLTSGKKGAKGGLLDNRFGEYFTDNFRYQYQGQTWKPLADSDHFSRTNTKFSDGVGTYNSAGDKYYFTSCYEGNAYCKLYVTYKENGSWKNPKLLNDHVNAPGHDNKHPTLTVTGDTLIFVSNRPGGAGGNDLWYSISTGDDNWQPAKPLPGNINTPFNEASPYWQQGNLLFFSSDGHIGMGGMDTYMAKNYLNDQTTIQNLGTPFNSGYDDSFFSLGRDKGYVSSNRPYGFGKFDIYGFNLPTEDQRLEEFLEESADGTQLRSRIRSSGGGNLTAARDEDQFYYDNLSAEERARLERILAMRRAADDGFDPQQLSKEDFKYYKKLDITTKATIERLARRRALELDGLTSKDQMSAQEKLDWEYYQNIAESEKSIVDRIIDLRIAGHRSVVEQLTPDARDYAVDQVNQQRIDDKVQLKAISSLADDLQQQRLSGSDELNKISQERLALNTKDGHLQPGPEQVHKRKLQYQQWVENLGPEHQLQYQRLRPELRDALHKAALYHYIMQDHSLPDLERQRILDEFKMTVDPLVSQDEGWSSSEVGLLEEIRTTLTGQLFRQQNTINDQSLSETDQVRLEMNIQREMLRQEVTTIDRKVANARDLQQQLQEIIEEQDQPENPQLEEQLVEQFYQQSRQLFPLLSSRESYYFNALSPGQQLRLQRLAKLVELDTREADFRKADLAVSDGVISPTDQWYYQGLTDEERSFLDTLIANGWNPEQPYPAEIQAFISGLTSLDRDRIDRMMGNQQPANLQALYQQSNDKIQGITPETEAQTLPSTTKTLADNSRDATAVDTSDSELMYYLGAKIYFDFDQYALRPEAQVALMELDHFLNQQAKPVKILIEGHTDNIGDRAYNQSLGLRRGSSAAKVLKSNTEQIIITTTSHGEDKPALDNTTRTGRQFNRRVEVTISEVPYPLYLRTYLVKPGATLFGIAQTMGVAISEIKQWNGLTSNQLYAYQPLRLPENIDYNKINKLLYYPQKIQSIAGATEYHVVLNGETLFTLSQRYHTTVQALEDINGIEAADVLPGQRLRIR